MEVCGTGKKRVINARPQLLTPKSVSKLYKVDKIKSNNKGRTIYRQPLLGTLPNLNTSDEFGLLSVPGSTGISPQTSPSLPRHDSFISDISSSSEIPVSQAESISGSELSLLSYDDDTGSVLSDTTDQLSITSENYKIGDYPLTSEWIRNQKLFSKENSQDFDIASETSEDVPSISFEATSSDVDLPRLQYLRGDSMNSLSNRILKISSGLELPVTSVPQSPNADLGNSEVFNNGSQSNMSERESMMRKVADLKQSLKLAEADIAILVSSKQQLQLQYHENREKKKAITTSLKKYKLETLELRKKLDNTEKEFDDYKELNNAFTANKAIEKSSLEHKLKDTIECLDEVRNDRDSLKSDTIQKQRQISMLEAKVARLENEMEVSFGKIQDLEKQAENSGVRSEDSDDFIKHLKSERVEHVKQIQEKDYEILQLTTNNQNMIDELNSIKEEKEELKQLVDVNEQLLRKLKTEHETVVESLAEVRVEKSQLDDAVGRLYSDLSKVGESFARLKQQMNEKTSIAESLSMANSEMQDRLSSFADYIKELETNNTNLDMKISDKNVQIGQYLFKNKQLVASNTTLTAKITEMETFLNQSKKTWQEALSRDMKMFNDLKSKDEKLQQEKERNKENEKVIEKYKELIEEYSTQNKENTTTKELLKELKKENDELQKSNVSLVAAVQKYKENAINHEAEFAKSIEIEKDKSFKVQTECQRLQCKVDNLQRELVGSLNEMETLKQSSQEQEDNNVEKNQNSEEVNQILAELQSSRRTLSQEKERIVAELSAKIQENEHLQDHLDEMKTRFSSLVEEKSNEVEKLKLNLQMKSEEITALKEQLTVHATQSTDLQDGLKRELENFSNKNEELIKTVEELQTESDSLRGEIDDAREIHRKSEILLKQSTDELEMAKSELSSLQERLTEALTLQDKQQQYSDKEIEQIIQERSLLKDAVAKQQEYVGSLHKHYDKWAKDMTAKMQAEMQRSTSASDRERTSMQQERNGLLKQITLLEEKLAKQNLKRQQKHVDFGSQTQHDKVMILPLKQGNNKHTDIIFIDNASQTINATNLEVTNSYSQTEHDFIPVVNSQNAYFYDMVALPKPLKRIQLYDAFSQTDHSAETIGHPVAKEWSNQGVQVSLSQCEVEIKSTQTDHNNELLLPPTFQRNVSHAAMGTQTYHDNDYVSKTDNIYSSKLLDTVFTQTPVTQNIDICTQTLHSLDSVTHDGFSEHVTDSVTTQTAMQRTCDTGLIHHVNMVYTSSASTQTFHDFEIIESLQNSYNQHLLSTESTQTIIKCSKENGTQTAHELNIIGHKQVGYSPHLLEAIGTQTKVVNYVEHCTQTEHETEFATTGVVNGSTKSQTVDLKHIGVQTLHTFDVVNPSFSSYTSRVLDTACTQTVLDTETSSTQTLHEDEIVNHNDNVHHGRHRHHNNHYDMTKVEAMNCLANKRHVPEQRCVNNDSVYKQDYTGLETGVFHHLSPVKLNVRKKSERLTSSGSQTELNYDLVLQSNDDYYHLTQNIEFNDKGAQTEYDFLPVGTPRSPTQFDLPVLFSAGTQTDHNNDFVINNTDKQFSETNIGEIVCQRCKSPLQKCNNNITADKKYAEGDLIAPTPMAILEAIEGKKLKAYKKTVKLLKKKMEAAEKCIGELTTKLNEANSSGINVAVQCELLTGDFTSDSIFSSSSQSELQRTIKELELALDEKRSCNEELLIAKKSHAIQIDTLKRRNLAEKKILERKSEEMNERLGGLTESNKELRRSLTLLQVKMSEKSRLFTACQKDKQRYQSRARRLQASLRSLSWISGKGVKVEGEQLTNQDDEIGLNDVLPEIQENLPKPPDKATEPSSSTPQRKEHTLPKSVSIIEETLKNLQSEMVALERQVQDHNVAVRKNNFDWVQLKHTSPGLKRVKSPDFGNQRVNTPSPNDEIAAFSNII